MSIQITQSGSSKPNQRTDPQETCRQKAKVTQPKSVTTSLPRIEGEDATYTVEEAWSNLRQAKDYLKRAISYDVSIRVL